MNAAKKRFINLQLFATNVDLKQLLGEELYKQVMEKAGDNKIAIVSDGNWFPKDKFDQVNNDNKELKNQLKQRDDQLKELGEKAKGNEELTKQIEQLKEQNKTTQTEYEQKLQKQQFEFALDKQLRAAKVKNTKAIKALLDMDTIKLDGENMKGLEEQLKAIRETDGYLFDAADGGGGGKPTFTGGEHKKIDPTQADAWMSAFAPPSFGDKK